MRFIVAVGWAIYPAGYFFGYLRGSVSDELPSLVNFQVLRSIAETKAWTLIPSNHLQFYDLCITNLWECY